MSSVLFYSIDLPLYPKSVIQEYEQVNSLHIAAYLGHDDIITQLLGYGADFTLTCQVGD